MLLRITSQISNPEGIERLLRRIVLALTNGQGAVIDKVNFEVGFDLEKDFVGTDVPFSAAQKIYIDPSAKDPGLSPQTLTLKNVLNLIQSSFNTMRDPDFRRFIVDDEEIIAEFYEELRLTYNLLEKERGHVQHDAGDVKYRAGIIVELANELLKVLEILSKEPESAEEEHETFVRSEKIPEWLNEATEKLLKEHWKPITEVISIEGDEGFLDQAIEEFKEITDEKKFPGVQLRSKEETLSIITLRNFLNEWAKAIIEEDKNNPFPTAKKIFDPNKIGDLVLFPSSTTRSVAFSDLEKVQKEDIDAVKSFKELLLKPLKKFKEDEEKAPAGKEKEDEETSESGEQTQQPPLSPEDLEKLKDDVVTYQEYVQDEALRVQVITRNFILKFNNFPDAIPADLTNSPSFRSLEREINSELMEVLRRNPHAFDDPNTRAAAIRSFLFRLMASPKFQTYLALVKDKYAAIEASKHTDLKPEQVVEFKREFIELLNDHSDQDLTALIQEIYQRVKNEATPSDKTVHPLEAGKVPDRSNIDEVIGNFANTLSEHKGHSNKQFNPNSLTKEQFEQLVAFYGFSDEEALEIFKGIDILMFLRISPDRITRFRVDESSKIFLANFGRLEGNQLREFNDILAAYLGVRRIWFERQYNVTTVSQSQDAQQEGGVLTSEELQQILGTRDRFKNSNLNPEHFVRAASLTPTQLKSFEESGEEGAEDTQKADVILAEIRRDLYAGILAKIAQSEDEEQIAQLALQTGIQIRADKIITDGQKETFYKFLEAAGDLSHYEQESGIVLNDNADIIRGEEAAQQNYTAGGRAKPGVSALKAITDEGAALLGGAAAGALLPGVSLILPKEVKKVLGQGIVVVGGLGTALVGGTVVTVIQSSLGVLSQLGVVGLGGLGGGIGGAILGSAGGPLGTLFGAVGGSIAGAGGTAAAQSGLFTGILGSGGGITASGGFGAGGGAAGAGAGAASAAQAGGFVAKAGSALSKFFLNPAGVAVTGFAAGTAVMSIFIYNTFAVAFLPPDIITAQATSQSKYMTLSKTATPPTTANPAPGTPTQISYSVAIAAKEGYQVQITNISDTYSVKTTDKSTPTVSDPTNFEQYKTTLSTSGTPTETITYTVPFDEKFKDSLVTNTIQVTYNAVGAGANVSDSMTTQASVCFGNCPRPDAGCWPTTGKNGQNPFGPGDHADLGEDAFDISAPDGTPIYAPFAGTLCAKYMLGTKTPPITWGFGNYLTLHADANGHDFLFGHLSKFGPNIELNNCSNGAPKHVEPGDLIGYVGTTGSSWGYHLHYQVDIYPPRRSAPSLLRSEFIPKADEAIQVGQPIKSCYDTR